MIYAPTPATKCRACLRIAVCTVNILLVTDERQIRIKSSLQICADHRDTMRLDDVLDAGAWARLSAPFVQAGHPAPDRAKCQLEFVPIKPIVHPTEKILRGEA